MKKHHTVIRYFTVHSEQVDFRTTDVSCVPRQDEVVVIETKRYGIQYFVVERVVWAVGKLCTEAQVRLQPYTRV